MTDQKIPKQLRDSPLSLAQLTVLNSALDPLRIMPGSQKDGVKPHMVAYDVRAFLTKIFGYGGWGGDVLDSTLLYEQLWTKPAYTFNDPRTQQPKDVPASDRVSVAYRVRYRLTVVVWERDLITGRMHRHELPTFTEEAVGDAPNFPQTKRGDAHDFAVKTAESQALKRCAISLGDQFGLSLYSRSPGDQVVGALAVGYESAPPSMQQLTKPSDIVIPEEQDPIPDEERTWVDAAEAAAGDADALMDLYNDARARKARPQTLAAMRRYGLEVPE